jgi:hypothetical protein
MPSQSVKLELYYSGAWQDITATNDVYVRDTITSTRGDGDESAAPRPASVTATLDNRDNKFNPRNPTSPLYGLVGRNTPLRLSVGGVVRNVTEVSAWVPERTIDYSATTGRGDYETGVESGGLLRRLGQSSDPIRSAMYRSIVRRNLTTGRLLGYWPMEETTGATQFTNVATTGKAASFSGVTLAGADHPGGSEDLAELSTATAMRGDFLSASDTAGWQVSWVFRLTTAPAGTLNLLSWTTSAGHAWTFSVNSTAYGVSIVDGAGATVDSTASLFGTGASPIGQWINFRLKVSASGGTVTYEPAWNPEDSNTLYGVTDTYSGSVGRLQTWTVTGGADTANVGFGHLYAVTGTTDNLQASQVIQAFAGYNGETAAARFERLCDEEGITWTLVGTAADTQRMGAQRADTLLNLFKEIRDTEDGLLYDTASAVGLSLRTRVNRYNQTTRLALTWPNQVTPPLPEVIDDLGTHNAITVSQREGGEATSELSTGTLSTAAPPSGVGQYRQTVNVNIYAEQAQLQPLASWWLNRGTVDLTRYPSVTVDLVANPTLATSAAAVDIGDRITITGLEANVIDLYVVGLSERVGTHTRTITFTCAPGQQLLPGVWDSTGSRWDSQTTTLKTAVSSTATSLTFRTSSSKSLWSTTGTPYDVFIAGERVTVTAMGAASLVSGSYDQTATVTRSVNGIVKALAVSESIHVATPGRWAL